MSYKEKKNIGRNPIVDCERNTKKLKNQKLKLVFQTNYQNCSIQAKKKRTGKLKVVKSRYRKKGRFTKGFRNK